MDGTEAIDSNLLLITLSDSDSEPAEAAPPADPSSTLSQNGAASDRHHHQSARAERTALSEPAFQALKQSYRPKVENGEIHKNIRLPLPASPDPLPKPQAQELLHAVEELYFFRRYAEAAGFVRRVLGSDDDDGGGARVDEETRRLLRYYEGRCIARMRPDGGVREE
ncbi:hypothetical protein VTK56DRAFT_9237 [Thermocarpiscus australiensis]